ncbi:hypothetical protein HOD61_01025 [archaeon]|jgi:hypothetical protein|nr:hypothetical protein [archaeon]
MNYNMKGWLILGLVVLCIQFAIADVPSFEIYSGFVFCEDSPDHLSNYNLSVESYNGTANFSIFEEIQGGSYFVSITADETYNNSFFINNFFVDMFNYISYNYSEQNFSLLSTHELCLNDPSSGPDNNPSSGPDNNPSSGQDNNPASGPDNESNNGDENITDDSEEIFSENHTNTGEYHIEEPYSSINITRLVLFILLFITIMYLGYYFYHKRKGISLGGSYGQ